MKLLLIASVISLALGDVYFHNPRGSNGRLNGRNRDRTNALRLFDSQNNARGGYNTGTSAKQPFVMKYYQGSTMNFEWTNQHQCSGPNANCNIVIQYMCSNKLRDGQTEKAIPIKNRLCLKANCDLDYRFGMHEDEIYYKLCFKRERNMGLFTADQELRRNVAKFTRQNPAGRRYGFECPEERDYYPYWGPTPWKDIAVMTDNIKDCPKYQTQSQNVAMKHYCQPPQNYMIKLRGRKKFISRFMTQIPITKIECEQTSFQNQPFKWVSHEPWGLPAPDCIKTPKSRDNHNGNGETGYPNYYNWTVNIPDFADNHCAFRIRYNITTADYDTNGIPSGSNPESFQDSVDEKIAGFVGIEDDSGSDRGYVFENNPVVQPIKNNTKLQLQLAINTAQYGRTFQDRSHAFEVAPTPSGMKGKTIHNLNVRGKRGNIVQVYPAVEYDFVPNQLRAQLGDYINIQWTGADTNPGNNNGNGPAGTDRSNLVELTDIPFLENVPFKFGDASTSFPKPLKDAKLFGFSSDIKKELVQTLNKPYHNQGLLQLNSAGEYNYVCTRNNDFTNRSQKGKLVVSAAKRKGDTEQYHDYEDKDAPADGREAMEDVMDTVMQLEQRLQDHIKEMNWRK